MAEQRARWMIRMDMEQVLDLSMEHCTGWGEMEFIQCLRQRDAVGIVCERGDKIVGCMIYHLYEDCRPIELLLAADLDAEQCLLDHLLRKISDPKRRDRLNSMWIDVAEWDIDRQLYLKDYGFAARPQTDEDRQAGNYRFVYQSPVAVETSDSNEEYE